jgi:hypothetical protein
VPPPPELVGGLARWALGPHPLLDAVLLPAMLLLALLLLLALWAVRAAKVALLLTAVGVALLWLRERVSGRPGGPGGRSDRYRRVMASRGWRRRRAAAIRRAGRRCEACGARGPLDVHHVSYAHLGAERPHELRALCPDCHGRLHLR